MSFDPTIKSKSLIKRRSSSSMGL